MLEEKLQLEDYEGSWYINMTNFPMWLKGDKTNPTLNYKVGQRGNTNGLEDEVIYLENGKQKSISGFDKPLNENKTKFIWRGNGLLWLLSSKWDIVYLDREKQIAITHFEKTLFTPEGVDVISKKKELTTEEIQEILEVIKTKNLSIKGKLEVIEQN